MFRPVCWSVCWSVGLISGEHVLSVDNNLALFFLHNGHISFSVSQSIRISVVVIDHLLVVSLRRRLFVHLQRQIIIQLFEKCLEYNFHLYSNWIDGICLNMHAQNHQLRVESLFHRYHLHVSR